MAITIPLPPHPRSLLIYTPPLPPHPLSHLTFLAVLCPHFPLLPSLPSLPYNLPGYLNLSQGLASVGDYGHGDRLTGVRYSVSNFVGGATRSDFKLSRVGTWQSQSGYIPCTAEGFLQGATTGAAGG